MRARAPPCCDGLKGACPVAQPAAHGQWRLINPMARCRFALVEPTREERRYAQACLALLALDVEDEPDVDGLPQHMRVGQVRPCKAC